MLMDAVIDQSIHTKHLPYIQYSPLLPNPGSSHGNMLDGNSGHVARTCELKQVFLERIFKLATAFDRNKCLQQLNCRLLSTYAPFSPGINI